MNQRKEKLLQAKDSSGWELSKNLTMDEFQATIKDKAYAFSLMLPKETQSLSD